MNYYLLIILKIFYWVRINNKSNLCNKLCSSRVYNNEFVDFKLKSVKMTGKFVNQIDWCIMECENKFKIKTKENKLKNNDYKNVCLGNEDYSKKDNKEYLKKFSEGPCNPVIIIPGIFATVLEIVITDCKKFKNKNPNIYSTCGFYDCDSPLKPKSIYKWWLPDVMSPLSIFSIRKKYTKCFSLFIEVLYSYDKKTKSYIYNKKEGIEIRPRGVSRENAKEGNCGIDATQELFPIEFIVKSAYGFHKINDRLKEMGYRKGLTMQHLPYDFRLSIKDNDLNVLFKENVKIIYNITKKK